MPTASRNWMIAKANRPGGRLWCPPGLIASLAPCCGLPELELTDEGY